MAVYTSLSLIQIEQLLTPYELGEIKHFEGISDGIENTNYRISTDTAHYILTIYEHFNAEEVPFYLQLLTFLRRHDMQVPEPVKHKQAHSLNLWQEKPVAIFKCLPGHSLLNPDTHHCQQIGTALAKFHLIGQQFSLTKQNAWGPQWMQSTGTALLSQLNKEDALLLADELLFQQQFLLSSPYQALPQGIIHADLFRDNALFERQQLSGILDFYTACNAPFIYDLAITANDWCLSAPSNDESYLDLSKSRALFNAYQLVRPITPEERLSWSPMLRAAALRFWLSRLIYAQSHKEAELTLDKDPDVLKCLLIKHRENINFCQSMLAT